MIRSLLDTDLYKLTMCQSALHKFPSLWARYKFKCRNAGIVWTPEMFTQINEALDDYCTLKFTDEELEWISKLRYIKKDFVEFLRIYQPQRKHVDVKLLDNGKLDITVEGPWFLTIFFEIPILSIVNEVYFSETVLRKVTNIVEFENSAEDRLNQKIEIALKEKFLFSDFGTRRRFSAAWQDWLVGKLAKDLPRDIFGGTSNMYLAKKYNLTPIGTMAHEYICAGQGLDDVTIINSQKHMLQAWVDEYRGDLGTALSDTLGMDKFLKDFDLYFAKLYDGVRHDSGDPIEWGERMIAYYEGLKIDPRTKQLTFSDGLTFPKAAEINNHFKGRAKVSFGIGTNLTNDMEGVTPLNIVVKMTEANGRPVAKLSNSPGKIMCEDQGYVDYLTSLIKR